MKITILLILTIIFISASCDNNKFSGYNKAPLPDDFLYHIVSDKSNEIPGLNFLVVEINQKIKEEQIATLAEKLFLSKPKRHEFRIYYFMFNTYPGVDSWAKSFFQPELQIDIRGSTAMQDAAIQLADRGTGQIIGRWLGGLMAEPIKYLIFKSDNKIIFRTISHKAIIVDDELIERKVSSGTRYDYKAGSSNRGYIISNSNGFLEFFERENEKITQAINRLE